MMSHEKKYLQAVVALLDQQLEKIAVLAEQQSTISEETLNALRAAVHEEKALRKREGIGVRFSVIASQLEQLLVQADAFYGLALAETAQENNGVQPLAEDEQLVYIYLYNAQGRVINSWERFLQPAALREHSVNRPIYASFDAISRLFRHKSPAANHGCLEMKVKKADILMNAENTIYHDEQEVPLLRLRQDALTVENILSFFCDERRYLLTKAGRLQACAL